MNASTNDADRPAERRGLNFWQWLGIAIIVIGVLFYLYRNLGPAGEPDREEPPVQPDTNDTAPVQAENSSDQPAASQ